MSGEERTYTIKRTKRAMGRSTITLDCPFCGAEVTAYTWSMAGRGKRCACGAVHHPGNKSILTAGARARKR